ncbi:MAG: efflux RND transporter permease subunit [Candidatus Aminicenantes bacterium]|nr:efflux RND transporter permease subunit [Candidatus Aminicenantes bacterium]
MIAFFVRRPVLVAMILAGLSLLGLLSYSRLPLELLPATERPRLIVTVGGGQNQDPAYVEQHAVIPLEGAIASLEGIERIETRIDGRRAMVTVYYEPSVRLKYAALKLQRSVALVQSRLGTEFTFSVSRSDAQQLSNRYMILQARGEGSLDQIRAVVDEKIIPDLTSLDGVASVEIYGGRRRSVEVLIDENALKAYGLTVGQVASKLSEQSGKRLYLGQAEEGAKTFFVNLISEYASLPSLGDLIVKDRGPVVLKQIAVITEGGAEEESISRVNGREAVSLTLQRSWEANLINLAHRTRRAVSDLGDKVAADGITLVVQADEARLIEDNIRSILWLALVGGLLAVAVLWIFLRNPALVLTVSATVPISILTAMNVFYALGISLNTLTMIGLAIAIGMLVDGSIVVLESILRRADREEDAVRAAVRGTNEVARAIVASTLTTIAIFTPFLFSANLEIRTLGWQVGAAIITTLLVSLGVAFMLIPVLARQFLSRRKSGPAVLRKGAAPLTRMKPVYLVLLKTCLRSPARTITAVLALFFLGLGLSLAVSVNASREAAATDFSLYVLMPSGTTLLSADEQVKGMDEILAGVPEISERLATIGEDNVTLTFKLVEDFKELRGKDLSALKEDIVNLLSPAYPRADFSTTEPQGNTRFTGGSGGSGGGAVGGTSLTRLLGVGAPRETVVVRGRDLETLRAVAEDIQYNIGELDSVQSARVSVSNQNPRIDLVLDQAAMSHFDVSLQSVRNELSAFQRQTTADVKFKAGADEIDILLKSAETSDKKTDDLRRLQFPSAAGGLIPLSHVSRWMYSSGEANINRVNQEKRVEVAYRFISDVEKSKTLLEQARASIEDIVGGIAPPPGVVIEVEHDVSDVSEFTFLMILGIALIYMILASTFESLRAPLVMMFALPLGGIGAFFALLATGHSLSNANVLIGFLILFGVVVNNGVLLVDKARRLERDGFRAERALMTAGLTRIRPILITAITTTLGMLPVAMGQAEYVSLVGAPFAVTVIGGLAVATLLTLILVPTVSYGLDNALGWWRGLGWRLKLVQAAVFAGAEWLLLANVEETLWRAVYTLVLLLGIPAFTSFAMTSLRRSRASLIPPGTPITVTVRNVSKLYDDFSRFAKEWRKSRRDSARRAASEEGRGERRRSRIWKIPVFGFLAYFTYLYLPGTAWLPVFALLTYLALLGLTAEPAGGAGVWSHGARLIHQTVFWILPLADGLWLGRRWGRWGPAAVLTILWYAALAILVTARRVEKKKINVDRITGRAKKLRTAVYRFVRSIPVLGGRRAPFQALDRIQLEIGSGMFGLIGPNGSGKTTLMRIICGLLPPTRGRVGFNGLDLVGHREELQSLIGYLPQEFGAYENMTAERFLDYQAQLKGIWNGPRRAAAVESSLRAVHLFERRGERIKSYSGGMKQRLGIAQTLLHLPRILVVDEPTAGLDPNERIRFRTLLSELARDRIVIFSTHIIEDISSSCNRLAVLLRGRVRFTGTPSDLVQLTRGSIWQAVVDDTTFEGIRRKYKVLHHLREGDMIRVRILAAEPPFAGAQPVTPTLEDSYMWLLGQEA